MTKLDDLTLPKVDSTTLHTIYGRYLRRQSKLLNKIHWSKLMQDQAEDVDKLSCLIRVIQEQEAGLYFSLLRLPSIGGHLRCVEGALRDGNQSFAVQLSTEMWAQILVELQSEGRVEEAIRLKMGRNDPYETTQRAELYGSPLRFPWLCKVAVWAYLERDVSTSGSV